MRAECACSLLSSESTVVVKRMVPTASTICMSPCSQTLATPLGRVQLIMSWLPVDVEVVGAAVTEAKGGGGGGARDQLEAEGGGGGGGSGGGGHR